MISYNIPMQVGTSNDWRDISAGIGFTLGIKNDGSLWGWGYNSVSQLGNGNTQSQTSPIQIGTERNWKSVSCDRMHSAGITTDGYLKAWGFNATGGLGDGTYINRNVPTQIGVSNNWQKIQTGNGSIFAINSSGQLYAWGLNGNGIFGNGNSDVVNVTVPTLINSSNDWAEINVFKYFTLALKKDKTLWVTGQNTSGQLGLGMYSIVYEYVPGPSCNSLDLESKNMQQLVSVYPNPTTDILNVETNEKANNITIYDIYR